MVSNVENLVFSGVDDFSGVGTSAANSIVGDTGDDTLTGGAGNDSLVGGGDNDTADYSSATSAVTVSLAVSGVQTIGGGAGNDILNSIENLSGSIYNDSLTGDGSSNSLYGGLGDDTLDGGAGNDTYVVDSVSDVVSELDNNGTDTVLIRSALLTYTLGSYIENLEYVGVSDFSGHGNNLNNLLVGGSGNDRFVGDVGNDTLDGGMGNNTMVGGAGDDVYIVNSRGDVINEVNGEGVDTVITSLMSLTLANEVEILRYVGSDNFYGVGNNLDNTLVGGLGNDVLISIENYD